MSQSHTLYRLQLIDSQLDRSLSRMNQIEQYLADEHRLGEAGHQVEMISEKLRSCELHQEQIESEIKAKQIKLEQTEAGLYGGMVKNPKELQDLQMEASALKRYLVTLEDRLLDAMQSTELASKENLLTKEIFVNLSTEDAEKIKDLNQEKNNLQREIQKYSIEREAIALTMDAALIAKYDELRRQFRGLAVSTIEDNGCSACGSTLTLAQVQAARSPSKITHCPSCGRILYGT